MANADSNTSAYAEITGNQSIIAGDVSALLKIPLGATHDLFQVLDVCRHYIDELTETNNHAEYMALCGRLLAGLNVLRVVLNHPLPPHLIEQLTVKEGSHVEFRSPFSTDSERVCGYCASLTMLLLNQQVSLYQQEHITEMLYEVFSMLAEDLKAPRFVRTETGLAMLSGEAVPGIH